jgi:RsiW-degrading membrane proteinase PrsW (M82 family)
VLIVAVALLPVVAFLAALVLADSFKLVPASMLIRSLVAGAAAALAALALHHWLFSVTSLSAAQFSRYVAPVTEETLKAFVLLYPLRRGKIGFAVDAAIVGFAIGAGFALAENVEYLRTLPDRTIWLWIVRGFGTAILHGTTAAVIAIAAKTLMDRSRDGLAWMLPGWALAVILHSAFNHALVSTLLAATVLMIVLPIVALAVFARSERATQDWVGDGLDLDVVLLELLESPDFGATRLGRYLADLRERFPGPVVADMFCLLQLDLELGIRAKAMLIARQAGVEMGVDAALRARLAERAYLERAIGRTGLLALRPLQMTGHRDRWHRYLLEQAPRLAGARSRQAPRLPDTRSGQGGSGTHWWSRKP